MKIEYIAAKDKFCIMDNIILKINENMRNFFVVSNGGLRCVFLRRKKKKKRKR